MPEEYINCMAKSPHRDEADDIGRSLLKLEESDRLHARSTTY